MMRFGTLAALGLLALAPGCFATDLDAAAADVFACGKDAGDAPCPENQTCSLGRCRADERLARIAIDGPPDGGSAPFAPDAGATHQTTLQLSVDGEFELVDPTTNREHVFGQGHIVVAIDGMELTPITSGVLSGGREITIQIPNVVGAHRLSAELRRNDGERYDHEEGVARNLFWLADGTPRVAVTNPWPGEAFSLEEQAIDVEVGVIDFEITPGGAAPELRRGHAHVHYDDPFPECPERDDGCDGGYIVIADTPRDNVGNFGQPGESNIAELPVESSPRDVEITAILRHVDHGPYRLPDMADGMDGFMFPPLEGAVVFDTITIQRR
ncbi:MAG: hypothetical protein AAF721_23115 [Myxococcota bacterium]